MAILDENSVRTKMDEITERAIAEHGAGDVREINDRLQRILDRAPSDASAELYLRKSKGGYQGLLKIYSSQRRFVGGHVSKHFSEVVDQVFDEVRQQINAWKRERDVSVDAGF